MKFAILGYGKMGRMVEEIISAYHFDIVAIIDNENDWQTQSENFRRADVAIDFSMPDVAVANMKRCFEHHIPVVVGTTGWHEQLESVLAACKQMGGSLVYGSNFSVGANIFMHLNRYLTSLMNGEPQYAADVEEVHHLAKKDAPSGTAITLAKGLIQESQRYENWTLRENGAEVPERVLPIRAVREGEVPGIHTIAWHSPEDDIVITHSAHNRKGFAAGAVRAAIWLTQHPGIFDFQDIALTLN